VFNIHFTSSNQIAQGLSEGRAKLLFQHWPPLVGYAIHLPHLHGRAAWHAFMALASLGVAASLLVGEGIDLLRNTDRLLSCAGL
jgi:hypothetical protein